MTLLRRLWTYQRERFPLVAYLPMAETRALGIPGMTHAANLGMPDPVLGQRAVLCVEYHGRASASVDREAIRSALHPIPVDEMVVLRRIPRDPRHASKTDAAALRQLLARGKGV